MNFNILSKEVIEEILKADGNIECILDKKKYKYQFKYDPDFIEVLKSLEGQSFHDAQQVYDTLHLKLDKAKTKDLPYYVSEYGIHRPTIDNIDLISCQTILEKIWKKEKKQDEEYTDYWTIDKFEILFEDVSSSISRLNLNNKNIKIDESNEVKQHLVDKILGEMKFTYNSIIEDIRKKISLLKSKKKALSEQNDKNKNKIRLLNEKISELEYQKVEIEKVYQHKLEKIEAAFQKWKIIKLKMLIKAVIAKNEQQIKRIEKDKENLKIESDEILRKTFNIVKYTLIATSISGVAALFIFNWSTASKVITILVGLLSPCLAQVGVSLFFKIHNSKTRQKYEEIISSIQARIDFLSINIVSKNYSELEEKMDYYLSEYGSK